MSDVEKCPKCGAASYPPVYGNIGSTRTYWACGSHSEGKQSDECRIVEITAEVDQLQQQLASAERERDELRFRISHVAQALSAEKKRLPYKALRSEAARVSVEMVGDTLDLAIGCLSDILTIPVTTNSGDAAEKG